MAKKCVFSNWVRFPKRTQLSGENSEWRVVRLRFGVVLRAFSVKNGLGYRNGGIAIGYRSYGMRTRKKDTICETNPPVMYPNYKGLCR
jgi:hypothetical protein